MKLPGHDEREAFYERVYQHKIATAHRIGTEGMVTVHDHENRYLGCMGIETWRGLVARKRKEPPQGTALSSEE